MKNRNLITTSQLEIHAGDIVVLGAPWEGGSSYLRGTAQAPERIREALDSPARSLVTESGLDLEAIDRIQWLGDLDLTRHNEGLAALETATEKILVADGRLLTLGGDHSITPSIVRPLAKRFEPLTVVQIDAHPDLYDEYEGDRSSHACPMARIMEEKQVARLVQFGIRAMTPVQKTQMERFGVEVVEPQNWSAAGVEHLGLEGPVYLSLDLDGLDPAFAPGVSHPEPAGLTSRQVIEIVRSLVNPLVGADIVELNPLRDVRGLTALVASKLTKEILAKMLEEPFP